MLDFGPHHSYPEVTTHLRSSLILRPSLDPVFGYLQLQKCFCKIASNPKLVWEGNKAIFNLHSKAPKSLQHEKRYYTLLWAMCNLACFIPSSYRPQLPSNHNLITSQYLQYTHLRVHLEGKRPGIFPLPPMHSQKASPCRFKWLSWRRGKDSSCVPSTSIYMAEFTRFPPFPLSPSKLVRCRGWYPTWEHSWQTSPW